MRPKVPVKPFGRPAAVARKSPRPRLSIRPAVFYVGFAGLLATNVLTLVGLLMAPDIARLVSSENQSVLGAYQDRLTQLRLEVDRLQSRHYAQAGDINLQLQELAQTQQVLLEQHQYVKQLADKAAALGIDSGRRSIAAAPAEAASPVAATVAADGGDAAAKVAQVQQSLTDMMEDSRLALATLSDEATARTDKIMGALASVGIKPDLPDEATAEGGPLLPPVDSTDTTSLIDDANAVAVALDRFRIAKQAADGAPIHKPLVTFKRVSSTFGNRRDPFTGRLAFHSGIDFAAPRGTTVLSAGAGKVSFVGQISGYGNVVEVTHPDGLVTRYGHLSAFLVQEGDTVATGTPIARVGSTGRSTGPHLHFEVRNDDSAVNPARYLNAGKILRRAFVS